MTWTTLKTPGFVFALAVCFGVSSIAPGAALALPSEPVARMSEPSVSSRQAQIAQVLGLLARPEAQAHLHTAGMSLDQVEQQLARLDDVQLARLARGADALKAGGEPYGEVLLLGIILAVLLGYLLWQVTRNPAP